MVVPLVDFSSIMEDVFSGTVKKASGTVKKDGWRLDFTADSPSVVRARLRRGRGKGRNNVKDESGTVIVRNYVPLGRIEDVENDQKLRRWHARCKSYRSKTGYLGSGDAVGVDSGTPKRGVAQPERSDDPLIDPDGQEKWSEIRGGILGVRH